MSEHTAAAVAQDFVDAEPEETGLVRQQAQISIRHEMSPESLRAQIARETEMQSIVTQYVRDHMVKDHHYYSFNDAGKPALTKDGAHRICSLFKVIPGPVDIEIIREDGGHFTVVSHAHLLNQDGVEIASSRGSASTRESKYAYRWVGERYLPSDVDKATLKSRVKTTRAGGSWTEYQLPNSDLADLENTILKMSEKRATVGAVNKLPLVSELFANDPDDHTPETKGRSQARKTPAPNPAQQQRGQTQAEQAPSPDDPAALDTIRVEIEELLTMKIGDATGDRAEFLKGRDPQVMSLAALKKLQGDLAAM